MGSVYRARHKSLDKIVALKLLAIDHTDTAIVRFHQEAVILSKLHNQFIADVYDFGVTPKGQLFMAIEYINGPTLHKVLEDRGKMPLEEVTTLAIEICQALKHAHQKGVIHRDIKPSNVMMEIKDDGTLQPKVVDFGIAKTTDRDSDVTKKGGMIGSPLYMSPEQSFGHEVTAKSDMYSLGCVIYHCLTGEPLFLGDTILDTITKHRNESPPELVDQFPADEQSPELASMSKIVDRMLAKDPAQRFSSLQEVETQLEQLFQSKPADEALPAVPVKKAIAIPLGGIKILALVVIATLVPLSIYIFNELNSSFNAPIGPAVKDDQQDFNSAFKVSRFPNLATEDTSLDGISSLPNKKSKKTDYNQKAVTDHNAALFLLGDAINHGKRSFDFPELALNDDDLKLFELYRNVDYVNFRNVKISEKGLEHLKHNKIKGLEISGTRVTTLENLPAKNSLIKLQLNNCRIDNKSIESLKDCPNMRFLELNGVNASPEAMSKLAHIPLESVICNKWSSVDLARLEAAFPNTKFNGPMTYFLMKNQEAHALLISNKIPEAMKIFQDMIKQGKQQKNLEIEADGNSGMARVLSEANRLREALPYFKKATRLADQSQRISPILNSFPFYLDAGEDLYKNTPASRAILRATVGRFIELVEKVELNPLNRITLFNKLARKMRDRNQLDLVQKSLERSLAQQKALSGEERFIFDADAEDMNANPNDWLEQKNLYMAITKEQIADVLAQQNKMVQARWLFKDGISDLEKVKHPDAAKQIMINCTRAAQYEREICKDTKTALSYITKCEEFAARHEKDQIPPDVFQNKEREKQILLDIMEK